MSGSDTFWRDYHGRPIGDEAIVSGFHIVELLEELSPYQENWTPYFARVEKSVGQLPYRFRDAALAVFGNVVYVHQKLLDATHPYHWHAVREHAGRFSGDVPATLTDIHLFEVDPSGLVNKFVQHNGLSGRLNPDQSTRIDNVQSALRALDDATMLSETERGREAFNDLWALSTRGHWLILTDKVLSGQALTGDLQRYITLRNILCSWNSAADPIIYVCAQIMTQRASSVVAQQTEAASSGGWSKLVILPAIMLSESLSVNSANCALFSSEGLRKEVHQLCDWFADSILAADKSLATVIKNSGDRMVFGYGGSGLLLVDPTNTPTNSLPVLWYNSVDPDSEVEAMPEECPIYVGPFPRTHSRRGIERKRASSARWLELSQNAEQRRIVDALRLIGDQHD